MITKEKKLEKHTIRLDFYVEEGEFDEKINFDYETGIYIKYIEIRGRDILQAMGYLTSGKVVVKKVPV